MPAVGGRTDLLRAILDGETVIPLRSADSALLGELSRADALILRPADAPAAPAGEMCTILPLA